MPDANSIFHSISSQKELNATKRIAAMAIECCSTLSIAEVLCENLTAYDEIRLYRTCKAIHHGNQTRREWWQHMENMILVTMSDSRQTHGETNALLTAALTFENVAEHNRNTRDT